MPASSPNASPRTGAARMLPGTRGNHFTTIEGNALDSGNRPLPEQAVRLRDARTGRIVEAQLTDKAGLFAFRGVDPGSYIVEIVGPDQTILGASQMVNVNAGEVASAIVKLPFRISPFAGILGHTAQSAAAVLLAAGSAAVLTAAATRSVTSPE